MKQFLYIRLVICLIVFSVLSAVSTVTASEVNAQTFKFQLSNPSQSIKVGDNFDVKVMINTASEQTINGDALITFEPAKINVDKSKLSELVKQPNPPFFTYFSANMLGGSNNKLLISSWEESIARPKSSSTDTLFATLTFSAVSNGTTNLSFDCTSGNEADSNINRASDSKDIIKCPLPTLSLNIGGAQPTTTPSATPIVTAAPTSTPSATPTKRPTSTPVPTNTPRPTVSVLPRAGAVEVTLGALGVGIVLTVAGVLFIL